jgi:hypothetical protein
MKDLLHWQSLPQNGRKSTVVAFWTEQQQKKKQLG